MIGLVPNKYEALCRAWMASFHPDLEAEGGEHWREFMKRAVAFEGFLEKAGYVIVRQPEIAL